MAKRVLFAASEVYPFAKTGGLADVAHSLPKALCSRYDVHVVLPLYRSIDRDKYDITLLNEPFNIEMGGVEYTIEIYGCLFEGVECRFVYAPLLCERDYLYGPPECGYEDNALRFGLFSHVLAALIRSEHYDILHLNDWQCALAALLIREDPTIPTKTLYTIHNLAYQGIFEADVLGQIGINSGYMTMDALEFHGKVNFMKAGIAYSDTITTVSPNYAKEILTHEFGCGLEGFIEFHRPKLQGILNGIDSEHFSPMSDTALVSTYKNVKGKKASKSDILKHFGLKGATKPLFVFIGRFTGQKGIDLLIETLPKMAALECNIAILGDGEEEYHTALNAITQSYKNVSLYMGYDEALSHRMYAASDFLLMPSLFEPCGLNQMIAFAYGSLPVVHRVGGLADTVKKFENYKEGSSAGYGIVFNSPTTRALYAAVQKACELYVDKKRFDEIANHNMGCDFSWSESAKIYSRLYESISK